MTAGGTAERAARQAHGHPVVEGLARLGIAARGLVWLVLAALVAQIALGQGAQADQEGALRALRGQPFGEGLLAVLAVGFLGYAAALALGAAVGHDGKDDRTRQRLESAARCLVYVALAALTARFLLAGSSGGGGGGPAPLTARLLQAPGGRWLVGLAGLAVVGVGVALAVRALAGTHEERVETWQLRSGTGTAVVHVGTAGHLGRAGTVVLVGTFVVLAAVQADAREARGLDAALQLLADEAYGPWLLGLAVLGTAAYAIWSFAEAVLHRTDH